MNELTQYLLPQWISLWFLLMIPLPFILILMFLREFDKKSVGSKLFKPSLIFFVCFLAYLTIASYLGWFNIVSFPPRILLLTTFPYAFFLFGYFIKTKAFGSIIENTKIEDLVKLHLFRIIGIFFIVLALHDTLPKGFAFIAGFGDVITALSSIFVVKAIQNEHIHAKKLTWIWSIFGTVDIMFTAIAANVLTKISIETGSMGVDTLAIFPFCIIPAFAPPTILLIHWAIFQKLKKNVS